MVGFESFFLGYKQVALISFGKVVLEEFHTPFTCHVQLTFLLWHTSFWDVARFTYLVQFTAIYCIKKFPSRLHCQLEHSTYTLLVGVLSPQVSVVTTYDFALDWGTARANCYAASWQGGASKYFVLGDMILYRGVSWSFSVSSVFQSSLGARIR